MRPTLTPALKKNIPVSSMLTGNVRLSLDTEALAHNYRWLADFVGDAVQVAPVIKANAYGLGAATVAPVFYAAGARLFFVAGLDEGIAARQFLPQDTEIAVLDGVLTGEEAVACQHHTLMPVLNSLHQIEVWRNTAESAAHPVMIHLDTGMNRLGLSAREQEEFVHRELYKTLRIHSYQSHLACSDTPSHPMNARQLALFRSLRDRLPKARAGLANSDGVFLGTEFHGDMVRNGKSLYGVRPDIYPAADIRPVVRLHARILQIRDIGAGDTVGYACRYTASRPTRLATVAMGYAQGLPLTLGNNGMVFCHGRLCPIVGRVSMDLITVDITEAGLDPQTGDLVEILGDHVTVNDMARAAGIIPYDILTRLIATTG